MSKTIFIVLFVLFGLISCNNNPKFKQVKNLKELNQTDFIPVIEANFETNKNEIYAASFLLAWNEIKNIINEDISFTESPMLSVINESKSYQGVLTKEEYTSDCEVQDSVILARARFSKSLPFKIPLNRDREKLNFKNEMVNSFGFWGYLSFAHIVYFKNEDDFAIKVIPEDNAHEIILLKTKFNKEESFKLIFEKLNSNEKRFKARKNYRNEWKYEFRDEDRVRIPIINYNIEHNYAEIEGTSFGTKSKDFRVIEAYQRTAFILNEKGAEIESEVEVTVDSTDISLEEEIPRPKNMFFDKSFTIFLKRKDAKHPYFSMFVSNAELMEK